MKPILSNTEMVKAILAGRKTVTRRLIKPQPPSDNAYLRYIKDGFARFGWEHSTALCDRKLPYQIDDVLYVRETWTKQQGIYWHKAGLLLDENGRDSHGTVAPKKWKPSIHMPKEAARIFLQVTDVRIEPLRDITVEGILQEGIDVELPPICESSLNGRIPNDSQRERINKMFEQEREEYIQDLARHTYMGWCDYVDRLFRVYKKLWNSTIKKSNLAKYGWDANPWVWVMGFERISKEEALKNDD